MRKIFLALILAAASYPLLPHSRALAACAVTNLQVKDNAAVTAAVPYADDGSGASNCSPQIQIKQGGNVANVTAGNALKVDGSAVAATAAAQASTTSGQTGTLIQGAVTTSAPTYTTGQTDPLSLDTAGLLRMRLDGGSSINPNGLATPANSSPTVQASTTTSVAVTPTVTASAYSAGNVIGGIMTFASLLDSVRDAGVLESITVKFKGTTVTGSVTLNIFKASPSNGTYTDHSAPTWNAADAANLLGSYTLASPISNLGTMTVYNLDGIAKAIQGSSQSLFVVMTVGGTPTPASTSDLTVELGLLPG